MSITIADYVATLTGRLREAEPLCFVQLPLDGYEPRIAGCHENADAFANRNPQYETVRGWLVINSYYFLKHSVVEELQLRKLLEITPPDPFVTQRPSLFLRHLGTRQEFANLPNSLNSAEYFPTKPLPGSP